MSVSSDINEVQANGNGVTLIFNFPHYFLEANDLKVLLTDTATDVVTTQILNTDYTITGAGVAGGGSITFAMAPATGKTVTIINNPDLLQESEFEDNSKFPAKVAEKAWDKLTIITQRLSERIDRSISIPDGFVGTLDTDISGAPTAYQIPRINADADGIEWADPDTLGFDSASPTTTKGDISVHDGSTNVRKAVGANKAILVADDTEDTGLLYSAIGGSSTPAAGKVLTYSASSKTSAVWDYPAAGGGGSLFWLEAESAPLFSNQYNFLCYDFEDANDSYLYAAIRVPGGYVAGQQIKLRMLAFCSGTANTFLMQTLSTLIRTGVDAISSTSNQRTSTNTAVTMSAGTVNEPQSLVFDLTSSTGEINAVAVSGGDLILVRLTRDYANDTATETVYVPVYGSEVTFNG